MQPSGPLAVGLTAALSFLFLQQTASAQSSERVPGARPGTERWLVTLRDRKFDLAPLQRALATRTAPVDVDAVVAGLEAAARDDQREVVAAVEDLAGVVHAQWWLVNGLAVDLAPAQVDALRAHPRVLHVVADQVRRPGIKTATNAQNHATDIVQRLGIRGDGVTIAIIDSGVDENMAGAGRPHAAFFIDGDVNNRNGGGIGGSRLLANVRLGRSSADDTINHGTPVAGIAAAARWNTSNVADDGHAPLAKIVSYSVADDAAGGTTATILTNAWQRIAADKARYGIAVANCSYEGTFDENFPDMIALQQVAILADVVITGMAGNYGGQPGYGYAASNMLAVGACENDSRLVAAFSARGGTFLHDGRTYPDMVANGVGIVGPSANAETSSRWGQGTSYSAPQVAGAAALYRSVRPSANAMECRAAILASAEDVTALQALPDRNRNVVGNGYLRVDRLIQAAQAPVLTLTSALTPSNPSSNFDLPVVAGLDYGIAATWFRTEMLPRFEIDLELRRGNTVLAAGNLRNNIEEVIRYRATATETLQVRVLGTRGISEPRFFSLVATEQRLVVTGRMTRFGTACGQASVSQIPGSALPEVGRSYALRCSPTGGGPLRPMVMSLGVSTSQYGTYPLPFDLTQLGAPGCTMLVAPLVLLNVPYNTLGGTTDMAFPVPMLNSMVGQRLYHQALRLVPSNALGLEASSGIEALIGGAR